MEAAGEPSKHKEDLESEKNNDKPKKKSVIVWQCLNPECSSTATKRSLRTANSFALAFYGLEADKKKKRKICTSCHGKVCSQHEQLIEKLVSGESVLSEPLPVPREMVLLDDSDEESETDPSDDSEFEVDPSSLGSSPLSCDGDFAGQLDKIMGKSIEKMNFDFQLKAATKNLQERVNSVSDDFAVTDKMFEVLEKEVDNLRKDLYKEFEPEIKELPPVDLNKNESSATVSSLPSSLMQTQLPSLNAGPLTYPRVMVGQKVVAMRHNHHSPWITGIIDEAQEPGLPEERLYKVRFENVQSGGKKVVQSKILKIKHVAYPQSSPVRLPVGTRCVGLYKEHVDQPGAYYSGIVAEPPKQTNRYRYLVFFDDGYAAYLQHEELRVVCHQSEHVSEDVHPDSRDFIKKYLDKYPERPMVKLSPGVGVKTEWDGKWWSTKVLQVDGSLARLEFMHDNRKEWIYRGSTRLAPLFKEVEKQKLLLKRKEEAEKLGSGFTRRQTAPARRLNAPFVQYDRDTGDSEAAGGGAGDHPGGAAGGVKRPVARKSTTATKKPDQAATRWEFEGNTFQTEIDPPPRQKFRPHNCSPRCLADNRFKYNERDYFRCVNSDNPNNDKDLKNYNPCLIPIMLGWHRQITKHKFYGKIKKKVIYTAPCGRRLRSLFEVHRYLSMTESSLEIDFFNFDWWLHVYNEFKTSREFCTIKDLSYGKENVAISCVNSIDRNYPEYVEYSTVRLPQKDVHLNTDSEFMTSCDCTDDCRRKDKCACWQLTIQSTRCDRENKIHKDVGYQFRRLNEIVVTGIYECNKNCKCSKTCLNRVVQNPLRVKLQVFKTEKRGWGIRTLHDIPQGAFISVYVGNLYSSEEANKQGQNFGDEYFAELDMIEVIERRKDGYESEDSDEGFNDEDEDSPDPVSKQTSKANSSSDNNYSTEEEEESDDGDFMPNRSHKKKVVFPGGFMQFDGGADYDTDSSDGGKRPKRGGFSATAGIAGPEDKPEVEKFVSARRLFGRGEDVYIMDAKSIGNIGRYLNHSCNPNVFVQNVFVDTHDLRFPWIAFFTSHFIRAGGELCWDYHYEIGSVAGKEIQCSCGSEHCRGRLL